MIGEPSNQGLNSTRGIGRQLSLEILFRWFREILAVLLWVLLVVQLLIVDVIGDFVVGSPLLELALRYRILVFLSVVALLWLTLGNRRFLSLCGYILAYPFVVVGWHIPRILYKNWAVLIAFSPALHSIITSFRSNFIAFVVALVSTLVTVVATDGYFVILSMLVLAGYLLLHFIRRVRMAFSPSTVFADVASAIGAAWQEIKDSEMTMRPDESGLDLEEYNKKLGQNLLSLYMLTTALWFVGDRLQEVAKSRKLDLYFISSLMYTFLLTVFVFALEYMGLYRLIPEAFEGVQQPGFLDFLGLSFSTLMTSDISPLKPVTGIAQTVMYVQLFGSLMIIVLLVFVILTSIRERYKQDLDGIIGELRVASDHIGKILETNYELTSSGVEAWLLEFHPVATKWCLKVRHGEKRAKEIEANIAKSLQARKDSTQTK